MADELHAYVKDALNQGHSKQKIKKILKDEGIQGRLVDEAFEKAERPFPWHTLLTILGLIIIAAGLIYGIMLYWPTDAGFEECSTIDCFTNIANNCEPALFNSDEVGSRIQYSINDCTLTKEIVDFGPKEPTEVINFFAYKKMDCPFTKNAFNTNWVSLTGGINSCSGQLKDAIVALRSV